MEDKKLNEQESLELIARMIQNTQAKLQRSAGTPFLAWGYLTALLAVLIWWIEGSTGNPMWQGLWFLLPAIAFPITLYSSRKQQRMVRTYIDRVVSCVWIVFGLGGFILSCASFFLWTIPILFVILLMMGMGTALTGLIIRMPVVTACGTLGALLSLGCLFIPGIDSLLFFAVSFLVMMVIPGHVLNHKAAQPQV